jgi:hypothetical protein
MQVLRLSCSRFRTLLFMKAKVENVRSSSQLPKTAVTTILASFIYSLSLLNKSALQPSFYIFVTGLLESGFSMAFAAWLFIVSLKSTAYISKALASKGAPTCFASLSSPTPNIATLRLQNQSLITCRCTGNSSLHFSCSQYWGNTTPRASMIFEFGNLFSS